MNKMIEEAAKEAILENNYFMADPNNPNFVDRGLEQMRACKWLINYVLSLPLTERLTEEEKEQMRFTHKAANKFMVSANNPYMAEVFKGQKCLLESIFGADFFKEET